MTTDRGSERSEANPQRGGDRQRRELGRSHHEMNVVIADESGMVAHISTYDVSQSNGVIHVIDRVVLPK